MRRERPKSRPYALRSIGVIVLAGVLLAAPAQAADVCLYTTDGFQHAGQIPLARGLLVAGRGPTVSRAGVEEALEGIVRSKRRCTVVVIVQLPPPGEHPNDRRYPIAMGL